MKKLSHGLVAIATAAAVATAGTTTAAAQSSANDDIRITVGEIPDYAGMSADASTNSSNARQGAVGNASKATGASGDDVNVALGIGATILVVATGAALYLGAAQAGLVPGVSMQLPGVKLPELPSLPSLPRF